MKVILKLENLYENIVCTKHVTYRTDYRVLSMRRSVHFGKDTDRKTVSFTKTPVFQAREEDGSGLSWDYYTNMNKVETNICTFDKQCKWAESSTLK